MHQSGKMKDTVYSMVLSRLKQPREVRAVVGDGTGQVIVTGMDDHIWVRPIDRNAPVRAYGPGCSLMPNDLIIRVEVSFIGARVRYRVVGVDEAAYSGSSTGLPPGTSTVPPHGEQHQWGSGGYDTVWVNYRQYTSLLMHATNPNSMKVYVQPGHWWNCGLLRRWPGGESDDLSAYVPAAGLARYLLVYFDASTIQFGYEMGPSFADNEPFIPDARNYIVPAPSNALPLGLVLLRNSQSVVSTGSVWPQRSMHVPASFGVAVQNTLLIALKSTGLFRSLNGYIWTQAATDPYTTSGCKFVVVINEQTWIVFRQQSTIFEPLSYRTLDAGGTWATCDGFGVDLNARRIWCVWQDKLDPRHIVVVLGYPTAAHIPRIFVTYDAGDLWVEISNTGLPSVTATDTAQPFSIGVKSSTIPSLSLAIGDYGLYFKYSTNNWTLEDVDGWIPYAVISDARDSDSWFCATDGYVASSRDNWINVDLYTYDEDVGSGACHNIFQHLADPYHVSVGGMKGIHTATNAETFYQYSSMEFGQVGVIFYHIARQPSVVYFSDIDGKLYVSHDACVNDIRSLDIDGVISLGACPAEPEAEYEVGDLSLLELWLKV